jgi:hypothetical protein
MDAMGNHLTKLASRPGSNLAARRLCLTMAAAATRVGPSAAYGLVDKALALVRTARFPNPASLFAHTALTLFFPNPGLCFRR